jgi:formylmethanofuran dehydrogenase subunit E
VLLTTEGDDTDAKGVDFLDGPLRLFRALGNEGARTVVALPPGRRRRRGPVNIRRWPPDLGAAERVAEIANAKVYKATLVISPEAAFGPAVAACLAWVKEVHGAAGPWAVAGYRIGERALKELGRPRHSHELEIVHHCPLQVQYSCMADGLSAATGASAGKLNLHLKEAPVSGLQTIVRDRERGRSLTFTLKPEFIRSVANLPFDRLEAEGRRVASLSDGAIFTMSESK